MNDDAISEIHQPSDHDRLSSSRALSGSPDDGRGSVDRKTSWYQNTRIGSRSHRVSSVGSRRVARIKSATRRRSEEEGTSFETTSLDAKREEPGEPLRLRRVRARRLHLDHLLGLRRRNHLNHRGGVLLGLLRRGSRGRRGGLGEPGLGGRALAGVLGGGRERRRDSRGRVHDDLGVGGGLRRGRGRLRGGGREGLLEGLLLSGIRRVVRRGRGGGLGGRLGWLAVR